PTADRALGLGARDDRLRPNPRIAGSRSRNSAQPLDDEDHEGEGRAADVPGDLPAALGGKGDAAGLESARPVAGRALAPSRRGRPVHSPTADGQFSAGYPPPAELPPD